MLTSPGALVQGFLTLVTAVTVGRSSFAECPAGTFYNTEREECQTCATCPTNQIISKPCSERRDTICGPFNDFHGFHPAPRERLGDLPVPDEAADGGGKVNDGLDVNRSKKLPDNDEDVDEVFMDSRTDDDVDSEVPDPDGDASKGQKRGGKVDEDPDSATLIPASRPRHQDDEGPSMHNRDGAECQWKVLALALIVVLCVVCVFLIIFVFAVCYLRTRRAHLQKVLYSADMSRSSGRSLPASHPRYVPVLTHAPGTGSGCGGAMRVPPGGMVDSTYLYSEDYDADHSGQTVSTTKSSDYVYFKSPQNGNFCDAV